MKTYFNEDDFDALFSDKGADINTHGKGPDGARTPDLGATAGMQSDFDSMFSDLFNDSEMGDDQSSNIGKQDDTGAKGGSIDPQGDSKGNPPVKSEWDSLFEDEGSEADGEDCPECGKKKSQCQCGSGEMDCGKNKKKGKKFKSEFESLFEGEGSGSETDDTQIGGGSSAEVAPDETDEVADEFVDLMSDLDGFEF